MICLTKSRSAHKNCHPGNTEVPSTNLERNQSKGPRLIVTGIHHHQTIEDLYKYFTQFGEVKFCAVIPPSLPLTQLGDLRQIQVAQVVQPGYSLLVEVTEQETSSAILFSPDIRARGFSCYELLNPTKTSDDLIQTVKDRKLFVFGLKKSIHEADLIRIFSRFGVLEAVRIVRNKNDHRSKGFGFIIFKSKEDFFNILNVEGYNYHGKLIKWIPFRSTSKLSASEPWNMPKGSGAKIINSPLLHSQREYPSYYERGVRVSQNMNLRAECSCKLSDPLFKSLESRSSRIPTWHRPLYRFNRSTHLSSKAAEKYAVKFSSYQQVYDYRRKSNRFLSCPLTIESEEQKKNN